NLAFSGCSSLSNIVIPDSVTSIGNLALSGCSSLSNIVIPNSVASIESSAFDGCNFPKNLKQELISRFGDKIF
ncbi:leucine-rich repeat protein, partial [Segatella copri]